MWAGSRLAAAFQASEIFDDLGMIGMIGMIGTIETEVERDGRTSISRRD